MTTVPVDATNLKALHEHAKRIGALAQWADVAVEWAAQSEKANTALRDQRDELLAACVDVSQFARLAYAEAMGEPSPEGREMLEEQSSAINRAVAAIAQAKP